MNKTIIFSTIIITSLLVVCTTLPVLASKAPGQHQLNQLQHINNQLSHAADKLTKITTDSEPDDTTAQVRRFERVANILERAQERFDKISEDIQSGGPSSDPASENSAK